MKNIKNIFYVGMLALCTMSLLHAVTKRPTTFQEIHIIMCIFKIKAVLLHLSILRYQVLVL